VNKTAEVGAFQAGCPEDLGSILISIDIQCLPIYQQKGVICIINPLQLPNLYFSFKR